MPVGAGTNNPDQTSLCRKKWTVSATAEDAKPTLENDDRGDPDNCKNGDFTVVMEKTGRFFEVLRATISTLVTEQNEVIKQVEGTTQ